MRELFPSNLIAKLFTVDDLQALVQPTASKIHQLCAASFPFANGGHLARNSLLNLLTFYAAIFSANLLVVILA
jgi:hypothetical protein